MLSEDGQTKSRLNETPAEVHVSLLRVVGQTGTSWNGLETLWKRPREDLQDDAFRDSLTETSEGNKTVETQLFYAYMSLKPRRSLLAQRRSLLKCFILTSDQGL